MKKNGVSEIEKNNSYLIMGPWSHLNLIGKMNGFDFGPEANENAFDFLE